MAAAEVAAAIDGGGGSAADRGGGSAADRGGRFQRRCEGIIWGIKNNLRDTQFIIAIVELNSSFFHHPTTPKHCVHLSTIPT